MWQLCGVGAPALDELVRLILTWFNKKASTACSAKQGPVSQIEHGHIPLADRDTWMWE